MEHPPTSDQNKIIEFEGNSVVIAKPGTGKTLTLAYKIRKILVSLPYYKGVIAISFTNKASEELEHRSLATGIERKNSFFGTIDKFFLAEIIFPFGDRVFGKPLQELSVIKFDEIDTNIVKGYNYKKSDNENGDFFNAAFQSGWIILEKIGFLALYIFEHSVACQRYLKARFSHVIIDEYQDCGEAQYQLFTELVNLGIIGTAVGDIDQSIFVFAGKSPEYLLKLTTQADQYKTFSLVENHRCHPSIVNYSARLLARSYELQDVDEIRVFENNIPGSEIETAKWLSEYIPIVAKKFDLEDFSRVGVLYKNTLTGNIIHQHLALHHKVFSNTPLDEGFSLWSSVFRKVLAWAFSAEITKFELVENYLNFEFQEKGVRKVMGLLRSLESNLAAEKKISEQIGLIIGVAETVFPSAKNRIAVENLERVLSTPDFLSSYIPANQDEVQLLTLHNISVRNKWWRKS